MPATKQDAEYKTYGRRAGRPLGIPYDPTRCVYEIWSGDQCPRRSGKGPDGLYCGIHARHLIAMLGGQAQ